MRNHGDAFGVTGNHYQDPPRGGQWKPIGIVGYFIGHPDRRVLVYIYIYLLYNYYDSLNIYTQYIQTILTTPCGTV